MKKLIAALKAFNSNEAFEGDQFKYLVLDEGQYDEADKENNENTIYVDSEHPAYATLKEIDNVVCDALINQSGQANFTAMKMVHGATGCRITRGESDGFGWLTGVVNTPKGMFVYG